MGSPAGSFDKQDLLFVLRGAIRVVTAALLTYLISIVPTLHLGDWSLIIMGFLTVALHAIDRTVQNNTK